MTDGTDIQVVQADNTGAMSLRQVTERVNTVHQILKTIMKENTHYGTVPGCGSKMVLLKPAADVLAMTFRLVPRFEVTRHDLFDGHREYEILCSMHGPDGSLLGQGVGSASTMEKKYRYRGGEENPDIADVYNTVLKMGKKRAHIDATLTVTGAADLFTQDLIDEDSTGDTGREPVSMPKATSKPAQARTAQSGAAEGNLATVTFAKVNTQENKPDAAKKWTRYYAKTDDGWYSTFDHTLGELMKSTEGTPVMVKFKQTEKGRDILEIFEVEDVQEVPPEREELPDDDDDLPFTH